MKSYICRVSAHAGTWCMIRNAALLPAVALIVTVQIVSADSATWNLDPNSNVWDNPANWTPNTVPDAPEDIATFGASHETGVVIGSDHTINGIVFNSGADAYTLTTYTYDFTLSGAGITNDSGIIQSIEILGGFLSKGAQIFHFSNNASAGDHIHITTINGDSRVFGGLLFFEDNSTAGTAAIYNLGSSEFYNGATLFYGSSSAGEATIKNEPGGRYAGGSCEFSDSSSADRATITNNAALVSNGAGGVVIFSSSSDAASSTITCNASRRGSYSPAEVEFRDDSTGGKARIVLYGDGQLSIDSHHAPGVTIGALEGDGIVNLGANGLAIGTANLSTSFAGLIQGTGAVTKIGRGSLTLSGANSFTGGMILNEGALVVTNAFGSATGAGSVQTNAGTLAGTGIIAGATTIGTGAFLAPAAGMNGQATLTIQSALTFNADATYTCTFRGKRNRVTTDKVIANGVTINSGTLILLSGQVSGALTQGLVLTVISNTSANPITGTFSNLPDGGIVTIQGNNFQANYEGSDGNDLTLTTIP